LQPLIPLGAKGVLQGKTWEVIGFMVRSPKPQNLSTYWQEYLLFNPYYGFRFLVNSDNHWTLYQRQHERTHARPKELSPKYVNKSFESKHSFFRRMINQYFTTYKGKKYKLYHVGDANVIYVLGEFYWQVEVWESVFVAELIAPPNQLSIERSTDELVVSLGTYIHSAEIAKAFQTPKPLPKPKTNWRLAPNQPLTNIEVAAPYLYAIGGVSILLLLFFYLTHRVVADKKVVLEQTFSFPADSTVTLLSQPFELKNGTKNLEFFLQKSPLSNSWFYAEVALVNTMNGENRAFSQEVSFYTGVTGNEKWTEGSTETQDVLPAVPPGKYYLAINPTIPDELKNQNPPALVLFKYSLRQDVIMEQNYILPTAVLICLLIIVGLTAYSVYKKRWLDSTEVSFDED